MIFIITGGIGSGKSLSVVKDISEHPETISFVNFRCKLKNAHRLRYSDILIEPKYKKDKAHINWDFWNEQKKNKFSIYLDEAHNIINSRTSMSKRNILISNFISQIRKVLSDNHESHLYLISQKLRKIDINARDLCHAIIDCRKVTVKGGKTYIIQRFYASEVAYEANRPFMKKVFLADPYFKMYDSNELISFGDDEDGYV